MNRRVETAALECLFSLACVWRAWLAFAVSALLLVACRGSGGSQSSADAGSSPPADSVAAPSAAALPNAAASSNANGAPSDAPVMLEGIFSSEKKDFITDALRGFASGAPTTADGRPIRVHATFSGSVEPIAAIVAGTLRPHVFSPASSLVIPLFDDARAASSVPGEKPQLARGDVVPLVLSPVVIAMWRPMAEALGFPAKKLGWGDLAKLAQSPAGWSAFGHAEWGAFRFGHTNPEYSNSGLISVLAETYAGLGKVRGVTSAEVQSPRAIEFVHAIEGAVVHYGKSTGFFFDDLVTHGPSYLSAAVLYENLVVTAEKNAAASSMPFPLTALYPKEGTLWADHPYLVIDAPWVGPLEREAAAKLRDYLLSRPVQERALAEFGFRPANIDVPLGAPIDAAHGADPKEPKTLLEKPDARALHDILETWKARTKRGVDAVLVFDRSGSMAGQRLKGAREGVVSFLNALRPTERVSLMTFNQALDPPTAPGSPASLLPRVESIFAEGGTALYDAIDVARATAEASAKTDPSRIHAVVVLTDGEDNSSKLKLETLLAKLAPPEDGASIRIFTIGYGGEASESALTRIAKRTGGAYYHGDPENIRAVYDEIASFF